MLADPPAGAAWATRDFLEGGGEMGARMRAHDWSRSPLGQPETWPQSLRTLVRLMLDAKQAMFVAWGPALAFLYNDDYAPIFGAKHPQALGRPFAEVWSDIWDQIKPLVDSTLSGEAIWQQDLLIPMERNGFREDAYFTFSYTPVHDESGAIAGMFCAATETTDKVLAERRVSTERERLRELFHQAPGFMAMLLGPEHRFEMVNTSYYQLVGHRDILGKPVLEALPEMAGQGFKELLDTVYATGETFVGSNLPVMLQREPNSRPERRFVNFVYQPIRDVNGQIFGIFAEGSDVTDARRAEEALRASEARARGVLEGMTEGFMLLDRDFRVLQINREGLRIDGRPEGEIVGRSHWDVWPASVGTPVEEAYRRAMTERVPVTIEHCYDFGDRSVWLELRIFPVEDGGVAAFFRDVTSRREAAEALRASEARLKAVLENVPVGIIITEAPDGRVAMGNPQAERIFRHPILPTPGFDAYPQWRLHFPDGQPVPPRHYPVARALVEGRATGDEEYLYQRGDGTMAWMRLAAAPIRNAEGDTVAAVVAIVDIDQEKKAEEHQRLLINELNHRVKNTLATVQSIASQTLRNSGSIDEARAAMEERLFALSRAHDVLTRENWGSADLREIVGEAMAPYRHERESRLRMEGPAVRLPPRMALAIAMALQELATNAVKYGALSNATGEVSVRWTVSHRSGPCLHLVWSETGGPPVEVPSRRGFGTRLIERSLAHDLDGRAEIRFTREGVVCTVDAPLVAGASLDGAPGA
ncbi:PAS domain-containing sensor histidine kinase [Microvirga thermotolerans]|uniref:Blue-light-activated histidine kinase n=1 Tax=Microvirga thermotolerans TaxID=2651334 RepID=A0A5P9JSX1_9HYPH|nr:PAS domain-containing protein [Microvirga thermotolerans]QFU14878.1 PAS domain-containing protein [Microvirga thermotolerans]